MQTARQYDSKIKDTMGNSSISYINTFGDVVLSIIILSKYLIVFSWVNVWKCLGLWSKLNLSKISSLIKTFEVN